MALFYHYLAEPRLRDKNGDSLAREESNGSLSASSFALEHCESLRNAGPIISSLMGDYVTTLSYHKRLRGD